MVASPHWVRLKAEGELPLRRGAWYRVVTLASQNVTVEIQRKPVAVPRVLLEILEAPPQRWTVVRRPAQAVRLPASWGDAYGVCPGCRDRASLRGSPATLRCPRCNGLFPVAWEEAYLGRKSN